MENVENKIVTVGITGASGVIYGVRLTQELLKSGNKVHLLVTEAAWQVFQEELGWQVTDRKKTLEQYFADGNLHYHTLSEFTAPIASGSYQMNAMVVIPCSMGTLSRIAQGASGNLLERAADVVLKEGKNLIIVPRETPLHAIHLENMLKLSRLGARILPAMPGFYHKPESIEDIIDFLVGKTLDGLGISHSLFTRWDEREEL